MLMPLWRSLWFAAPPWAEVGDVRIIQSINRSTACCQGMMLVRLLCDVISVGNSANDPFLLMELSRILVQ